jgi:hypothetical protein
MSEDQPLDKSTSISDDKLLKLWKHAVITSLGPDNLFPAYKLYYILLRKEIVEKYIKSTKGESSNGEENVYD